MHLILFSVVMVWIVKMALQCQSHIGPQLVYDRIMPRKLWDTRGRGL